MSDWVIRETDTSFELCFPGAMNPVDGGLVLRVYDRDIAEGLTAHLNAAKANPDVWINNLTPDPYTQPYVVAGLYGGLIQWSMTAPGFGEPVFDVLDFDREGEDDKERTEWIEYATEVIARMRAYGLNVAATEEGVDEMRVTDGE